MKAIVFIWRQNRYHGLMWPNAMNNCCCFNKTTITNATLRCGCVSANKVDLINLSFIAKHVLKAAMIVVL